VNRKTIFLIALIIAAVFSSCSKLKESNQTAKYTNEDYFKISFIEDGGETAKIISYLGSRQTVSIPSKKLGKTIIGIDNGAFFDCTKITGITIPGTVTSIGDSVFDACIDLVLIDVDNDNKVYSSENGVLYNKDKTILIKYPSGKSGAFDIPKSVINIKENAFGYRNKLESVKIPNSITIINEKIFDNCANLKEIIVDYNNDVYSSENGVLYNKNKTILYKFPANKLIMGGYFVIPDSVTNIFKKSFYECNLLHT